MIKTTSNIIANKLFSVSLTLIILICSFSFSAFCATLDNFKVAFKETIVKTAIPLGGNAFITSGSRSRITDKGLSNWSEQSTVASVYFKVEKAGDVNLSLRLKASGGKSRIKISVDGKVYEKELVNIQYDTLSIANV